MTRLSRERSEAQQIGPTLFFWANNSRDGVRPDVWVLGQQFAQPPKRLLELILIELGRSSLRGGDRFVNGRLVDHLHLSTGLRIDNRGRGRCDALGGEQGVPPQAFL